MSNKLAPVAQLEEQRPSEPRVGGSNPSGRTRLRLDHSSGKHREGGGRADAQDLGSCGFRAVGVRLPPFAPAP